MILLYNLDVGLGNAWFAWSTVSCVALAYGYASSHVCGFFITPKKTKKILNKFYLILNKITSDYQINKK